MKLTRADLLLTLTFCFNAYPIANWKQASPVQSSGNLPWKLAFTVYSTASSKQAFPKEPTANLKQTFPCSAPYSYSKEGLPSATYNKSEAGLSM